MSTSTVTIQFIGKHDTFSRPEHSARTHQVHGSRTVVVREPQEKEEQADGMITDVPGLMLITGAADCQNFAMHAPEHGVIGTLHAGWKGLLCGAIAEFFATLKDEFGIEASAVDVYAGPSLCQRCADFTDPVSELEGIDHKYFDGRYVNLQNIATDQLLECGVLPEHFEREVDCTRCNPQKYWTYRGGDRESVQTGLCNFLVCRLD